MPRHRPTRFTGLFPDEVAVDSYWLRDTGTVLLPAKNREHLEEVDQPLREGLTIRFVDSLPEILQTALVRPEATVPVAKPVRFDAVPAMPVPPP